MHERLPEPNHLGVIMAALITEMERLEPGTIERMRHGLANGLSLSLVTRLRGPKASEASRKAHVDAVAWLDAVSFIAAAIGAEVPPKKPKKRR